LLANALACFLAQDYPHDSCKLLILDDLGQFENRTYRAWQIMSTSERFPSLPDKYNFMLRAEGILGTPDWDAVVVWDDDDIYLPWHLGAISKALITPGEHLGWEHHYQSAKPVMIYSLYRPTGATGPGPWLEPGEGRFHGSLAVTVGRLRSIGGWIPTRRADFDQQMITACAPAADTLRHSPGGAPSYIFRWGSTGAAHCQALMRSPDNENWYDRYLPTEAGYIGGLAPCFDPETVEMYRRVAGREV
jgi:hypothetical protein